MFTATVTVEVQVEERKYFFTAPYASSMAEVIQVLSAISSKVNEALEAEAAKIEKKEEMNDKQ